MTTCRAGQAARSFAAAILASILALPAGARAEEVGWRDRLRESGIDLRFRLLADGAAPLGQGDGKARFGGQLTARLGLDLDKLLGLSGTSIDVRFDQNVGWSLNGFGGALLPVNTAAAFPGEREVGGDLSAYSLTQRLGDRFSVTIGKLNMVERAEAIPLVGGGEAGGFMHLGLAAPASGVTPPYLFGAMATYRADWGILSGIVYDPTSAVRRDPSRGLFRDGVTYLGSVTIPVTIGGLPGFVGVKAVASTASGTDFSRLGEVFLPGAAQTALPRRHGIWYAAVSAQQYVWRDAADPRRGFGVFAQAAISDGNPTFLDWSVLAGLAGSSPIAGRENDRFGIGYFRYSLSNPLVAAVSPLLRLRDEQGAEGFYNWAVTDSLRLTLAAQYVSPVDRARPAFGTLNLRTALRF